MRGPPARFRDGPGHDDHQWPEGEGQFHRAKFKFSSEPSGARFECKLDKKAFKACGSPKIYRGLAPGKHTFRVRAVSASGLSDTSPAKRSFRVAP